MPAGGAEEKPLMTHGTKRLDPDPPLRIHHVLVYKHLTLSGVKTLAGHSILLGSNELKLPG